MAAFFEKVGVYKSAPDESRQSAPIASRRRNSQQGWFLNNPATEATPRTNPGGCGDCAGRQLVLEKVLCGRVAVHIYRTASHIQSAHPYTIMRDDLTPRHDDPAATKTQHYNRLPVWRSPEACAPTWFALATAAHRRRIPAPDITPRQPAYG